MRILKSDLVILVQRLPTTLPWTCEYLRDSSQKSNKLCVYKLRKPTKPRILLLFFLVMYCSGIVDGSDGQLILAEEVSLNLIFFLTQSIQGLMAQRNILAKMISHQNTSILFKTCGSIDRNTNLTLCKLVH